MGSLPFGFEARTYASDAHRARDSRVTTNLKNHSAHALQHSAHALVIASAKARNAAGSSLRARRNLSDNSICTLVNPSATPCCDIVMRPSVRMPVSTGLSLTRNTSPSGR